MQASSHATSSSSSSPHFTLTITNPTTNAASAAAGNNDKTARPYRCYIQNSIPCVPGYHMPLSCFPSSSPSHLIARSLSPYDPTPTPIPAPPDKLPFLPGKCPGAIILPAPAPPPIPIALLPLLLPAPSSPALNGGPPPPPPPPPVPKPIPPAPTPPGNPSDVALPGMLRPLSPRPRMPVMPAGSNDWDAPPGGLPRHERSMSFMRRCWYLRVRETGVKVTMGRGW